MPRVAIEDSLQQVKEYLQGKGYEVTNLNQQNNNVDAIVISGQDEDMLGIQDISTNAPVIDARGLTAEDIYQQLANRLK